MLSDEFITPLFYAVIEATEEAILNALLQAETMTGRDGNTAHALDPDRLTEVLRKYGRPPRRVSATRSTRGAGTRRGSS